MVERCRVEHGDAGRGASATGRAGRLERAFAWLRWVDATFSPYRPDSEIRRLDAGRAACATRTRRCARCSTAARRCGARPAAASTPAPAAARPVRLRQGLGGRARRRADRRGRAVPRRRRGPRARRPVARRDPPPARARPARRRADSRRRRGDVRRLRARPAHPRPAHRPPPPACCRSPSSAPSWHGRRVRHGGVRVGAAGPAWTAGLAGYEAMTILEGGLVP